MKGFDEILQIPGMLTPSEAEFLYHLGQRAPGNSVIVEIGSWKGKSTILLARGSMTVGGSKVYAIDPHEPLLEEGYGDDTEPEFRENIKRAGVETHVVPMVTTSEKAARGWNLPIGLLWIDGDHRYEQVKKDFLLWEPHVVEGGIVAMHDTIRKKGPKRVLWENVFLCNYFQDLSIVDNITAAKKVGRASWLGILNKWCVIICRALYIVARKLRLPYAKPAGRWFLRRLTT